MNTIERLKTPPMAVGLFLAGLLLFAVIGIAKELGGAPMAAAAQNSVGQAVQAVEVVVIQPATIPALGTIQTDQHGDRWVWLGRAQVVCQHINPETLTYHSIITDPAITDWHRLPTGDKQKIVEVCK